MASRTRLYYGSNPASNVYYDNNDCRIVKYNDDCVFHQYCTNGIQVWNEHQGGLLYSYIDHCVAQTISTPCQNGCGTININFTPGYQSYSYITDFWLNTTRITAYAYDAGIEPEEYWDITNIIAPSAVDIQNTSITLRNSNNVSVICYYGTSSGATTYRKTINSNSTATISGLTKGTTYYFFYQTVRTHYRKTSTRKLKFINRRTGEDLTEYGTTVYIDVVNNKDEEPKFTIYGATIEETTEIGTGTIDSSIISIVPQVAEWHTMWTGKDYKTPTKTQTTYDLDYFSGLQVGNNNLRVTGYYRNTPAGNYTITQADLPFSITNGNYTATLYSMECTASDTLRVSIKASAVLTNFYFTKIEQYY